MLCPRCQQDNPSQAKFCLECGMSVSDATGTEGSHAELRAEIEALRRLLGESLEQQTATGDILRVISRSPTDVQPVLDMLARSARHLCNGEYCVVESFDGERLHFGASDGLSPEGLAAFQQALPRIVSEDNAAGRAVLRRAVVQIPDVREDAVHAVKDVALAANYRSVVAAPMLRDRQPIGAIVVARSSVGFFPDRQVALLQTFADQAVIALENVRLFNELEARNRDLITALDQQTATSEILRVISSSPTDVQPAFDAIAEAAMRLCGAHSSLVTTFDGELLHLVAQADISPEGREVVRDVYPRRASRGSSSGRTVLSRAIVHIPDVTVDPEYDVHVVPRIRDFRSILAVPMLRDGLPIGTINAHKAQPGPFTDSQIDLLKTFADQAVIAIENVRLFKELQEKNGALTEALEQQTATSEILRVISSSPTDIQPVFDAIVRSAVRLCGGLHGVMDRFDGEMIHFVAQYNYTPEALQMTQRMYPRRPDRKQAAGRAILTGDVVNIADVQADPEYATDLAVAGGWRSVLNVPMLREGKPIGTIGVIRGQAGRFSDAQVELLRTFADQAVIAIENVRLFTELQARNRDLTATSAILQVISSSPTNVQPVFNAIVENAARLCDGVFSTLISFDGELMRLEAAHNWTSEAIDLLRRVLPAPPSRTLTAGRAILDRAVVHVPDVGFDREFGHPELIRAVGFRSILAVPMLRDGLALGVISVARAEPGSFSDNQMALLKTFADQAVIAIENVRLFKELESSNRELRIALEQQTATSELLKVIGRSTFDLQPVFEILAENTVRLCEAEHSLIFRFDGQTLKVVASYNISPGVKTFTAQNYIEPGRGSCGGRVVLERRTIQIHDAQTDPEYTYWTRDVSAVRTLIGVPMLRAGELLGVIMILRYEVRPFTDSQIALMETFADQAAIAIENVRLFKELEVANRELAAASQHKSEFLANMSHELRTPLNAILGFSEVLSEKMFGELNEKQEEYSKDIHASGQHLLSLINDILDLSKIEAGRMELELTDFDLPTALDNALMLVRERAQQRSLTLDKNVDAGLGQIQGDERKIRQVVLNLLSNAIKFTPEGGRIELTAAPKDGCVEVSVSDTGVGIAPEDQEKVFEEFRQVGTADKKAEGTGLGLTLCRKFIELHGGRIWVKSQLGVGSTFTFTIPVRRGE